MYIHVKEHPNLVRDSDSQAILNVDQDGWTAFQKKRATDRRKDAEHIAMKAEIERLKIIVEKLLDKVGSVL